MTHRCIPTLLSARISLHGSSESEQQLGQGVRGRGAWCAGKHTTEPSSLWVLSLDACLQDDELFESSREAVVEEQPERVLSTAFILKLRLCELSWNSRGELSVLRSQGPIAQHLQMLDECRSLSSSCTLISLPSYGFVVDCFMRMRSHSALRAVIPLMRSQ